jgi:tripartite-type tricarboxylate transporter receptor subunit TctC
MLSAQAQLKGGKLRALAITGAKRSAMMPDLPTLAEAGVPGYEVTGWYGVFVPAKTPRRIVLRLNAEIARILALPDVRQRLSAEGADLMVSTPDEFAAFIRSEIAKWAKAVKISGATAD